MTLDARALWVAVIHQALLDAAGERVRDGEVSRHTAMQDRAIAIARTRADAWIRKGGKDYRHVCALAGIDADALRDAYIGGRIDMQAIRGLYWATGKAA